jgi:hypothetical protein
MMPLGQLHKDKKKKNYAVLAMIAVWVVVIFCVAIIKMKVGS